MSGIKRIEIIILFIVFMVFSFLLGIKVDLIRTMLSGTRVMLGVTIDKDDSFVAADPSIEYCSPLISKLDSRKVREFVKYLPPRHVNTEDIVTGKEGFNEVAIKDVFKLVFNKYLPNKNIENYTLLIARRTISDSHPLISVWWFTYIHNKDLHGSEE
jgi:hypothetical protein